MEPSAPFDPLRAWAENLTNELERLKADVASLKKARTGDDIDARPLRLKAFTQQFPEWSSGKLRDLLLHRESNGLEASGAVSKKGARIFLEPAKFFAWLRGQRKAPRRR